ncbi:LuxR family transcriptional regulator [Streptomyces sp. NPDC005474]|uniref:helix-turn-helix transcriptional regulator n=1 Tax=Streptomyces sp. NPDC005474 TaxID=3154878 RepID=UPI003456A3E2
MSSRRGTLLIGREEELEHLGAALRAAGRQGQLLVVEGCSGTGKTALVETALRTASTDNQLVIRLRPGARGTAGIDVLLDQVCDTLIKETGTGTRALVMAVRCRQTQAAREGRQHLPLMLETLSALVRAAGTRPMAVVLDDAHLLKDEDQGAVSGLLQGLRSAGACVVICGVLGAVGPSVATGLGGTADRVLRLPPLSREQSAALIGRRLGMPAADDLVAAVRRGLGTVAGFPGPLLDAVGSLQDHDRLVVVDGRAYLGDPATPISMPRFRTELQKWLPDADSHASDGDLWPGAVLALLTRLTAVGETTVDDFLNLAGELGTTTDRLGRDLDTLADLGLVAVADGGRLTCAIPAIAAELPAQHTEIRLARLHARLVLDATRGSRECVRLPAPRLIDHALAAGPELPAPLRTGLLLAATREGGGRQPHRTLRACRALLETLPPDDPRLPQLLATAVPLMLRHGSPADLLALGDRLLPHLAENTAEVHSARALLASARALAAAHDQWLGTRAVTDHDSWATPVQADGIGLLRHALGRARTEHGDGPQSALLERLREALALGDLASAWEMLPEEHGTVFPESPVHIHRSLVREYLTGSWDAALALAGSLEATPGATGHGPLYAYSRSLAAEICRRRGENARAQAWLDRVTDGAGRLPLLSWARMGLLYGRGDTASAWRQGRRDCQALWRCGPTAGLERPLLRLLSYAVRDPEGAAAVRGALELLEELDRTAPSRLTRAGALLGRGIAVDDVDSAMEGFGVLADDGGRQLSFSTAVWLLRRTREQKWLQEAWRQSEGMSSRPAREALVRLAGDFGLTVPQPRDERPLLGRLDLRIIDMVVAGQTNRQIAATLRRSEKSVEAYLAKIFKLTGCRTRVELATARLGGGLSRTAASQWHPAT